jgi:hypothetical protein
MSYPMHHELRDEICDVMLDLTQYLRSYYQILQGSAYKTEVKEACAQRIRLLLDLAGILGDELILDLFRDYDSMQYLSGQDLPPGESLDLVRTRYLVQRMEPLIHDYKLKNRRNLKHLQPKQAELLRSKRKILMSSCKEGGRFWSLLQSIERA